LKPDWFWPFPSPAKDQYTDLRPMNKPELTCEQDVHRANQPFYTTKMSAIIVCGTITGQANAPSSRSQTIPPRVRNDDRPL
jgi:hypothetical protein